MMIVPGITTSSKGDEQSIATVGEGPDAVVVSVVVVVASVVITEVVGAGVVTGMLSSKMIL